MLVYFGQSVEQYNFNELTSDFSTLQINEGSHTCRRCGIKKSEYFCPKCKHFTGVDKNPFHCEKCEIFR